MDKPAIKKFAIQARKKLLKQIKQKLAYLKVDHPEELPTKYVSGTKIEDVSFKEGAKAEQREKLIEKINEVGKKKLAKEVAYTWFNRFIAIRFMEINGFLESGVRILSSQQDDKKEPQIVTDVLTVNLPIDKDKIYEFQDKNDQNGLFKYLLILQCNELSNNLPFLFEKINDYTELLLPDNLLQENSVIAKLVNSVDEDNFKKVEIIGWLYQYYVSERKDKLIKAKKKYKSEDIPSVTQLFTPHWIVQYMTENSLGRYWIESHPEHKEKLTADWEFFIENRDEKSKEKIKDLVNTSLKVEDIKVFDPAMGSGHILIYAFEVLYQIYQLSGYQKSKIPELILSKNLYGLDIDARATQLAKFALTMKARFFDTGILKKNVQVNLFEIKDSKNLSQDEIEILAGESSGNIFEKVKAFVGQFENAKTLGSIIKLNDFDLNFLENCLKRAKKNTLLFAQSAYKNFKALINQYKVLFQKYDITIANPPYMGSKYMNQILSSYVKDNYPDTKSDLFAVFIEMMFEKTKSTGHLGIMSPFVWMFIKSYEKLRKAIISKKAMQSLVKPSYTSFFESAIVPICSYTIRNAPLDIDGEFIDLGYLGNASNQPKLLKKAIADPDIYYRYTANTKDFSKISGSPIAYWVSKRFREVFRNSKKLKEISPPRQGLATGNNKKFLRNWHEVTFKNIGFNYKDTCSTVNGDDKWFPYNKGGKFRKWYGNFEYVINWYNDGYEIKHYYKPNSNKLKSKPQNLRFLFKAGITWSFISSSAFGVRYTPNGFLFDVAGSSIFPEKDKIKYILGILGTKISWLSLQVMNPTMNIQVGNVGDIPIKIDAKSKDMIVSIVDRNISTSKLDWDSRETSWDFEENTLIHNKTNSNLLSDSYKKYKSYWLDQFFTLHQNEEELNKIFIKIYELQDEMDPDVELRDITILQNEVKINEKYLSEIKQREEIQDIKGNVSNPKLKDGLHKYFSDDDKKKLLQFKDNVIAKQFISYAVGCMFGRYSLDKKGLAFAGGKFNKSKYKTFIPDNDAIMPILDTEYFKDDVVILFGKFVEATFGKETKAKNLEFIANTLGRRSNEASLDTIRRYFFKDFYKDHIKMYKKRPIYWLFTSGKQKAFNVLVCMHRYNKGIVAKVRTDYLHELQGKLGRAIIRQERIKEESPISRDKLQADKTIERYSKNQVELRKYDELLRHYADKQTKIDLDDGVIVNYARFKEIFAAI